MSLRSMPRERSVMWGVMLTLGLMSCRAAAQNDKPVDFQQFIRGGQTPEAHVYKRVGARALKLFVYQPAGHDRTQPLPTLVMIHGGGWQGGEPALFTPHCRYFASRGLVVINLSYRLIGQDDTTVFDCVADVKSAMRWVRAHAKELGIDPSRIAVAGDSAGGHLAGCIGYIDGLDDPDDDLNVSAGAQAVIMFNPVLDLTDIYWTRNLLGAGIADKLAMDRAPVKDADDPNEHPVRRLSPMLYLRDGLPKANLPPTLIVHGTADKIVPYHQATQLLAKMKELNADCTLITLKDVGHAFVIPGYAEPAVMVKSVIAMDDFLVKQGFLQGKTTLAP